LKKFPPIISIDTVVQDTTIYRDTTFYAYLPGDTVYRDTVIEVPVELYVPPVKAETELARARAWIQNQKLQLLLIQKDSTLKFKIDSAVSANSRVEYITRTETTQLPPKPFYKRGFFILAGVLFLLALIGVIKIVK
jgi:hypothetical protein